MKWNLWLGLIAALSVYMGLAIPLWFNMRAAAIEYSAPPGAAFLLAIPYALCSGLAVFTVCWLLQFQLKI